MVCNSEGGENKCLDALLEVRTVPGIYQAARHYSKRIWYT